MNAGVAKDAIAPDRDGWAALTQGEGGPVCVLLFLLWI